MKILHCCLAAFYIDKYGYQENVLPKMHKIQGNKVEILASTETYINGNELTYIQPSTYINEDEIQVTRIPYSKNISSFFSRKIRLYDGITNKLEDFNPDIIWIHGVQFLGILKIIKYLDENPNTKVIVDGHSDFTNSGTNWISKNILHKIIYRYCAKRIEKYTSKFYGTLPCRVDFFKDIYNINPTKVELLVMGVDDTLINYNRKKLKTEIREKHNIKDDEFLILSGGKINMKKNIHLLVDAFSEIENKKIKLIIFGKIDDEVNSIIENKLIDDNIINIGWLDNINIHKYLLSSDLVVFPGKHSVLWEQAVGCGVPGIFKKIKGHEHIDIGGNCLFLQKNDKNEIKDLILKIFENKELYEKMKKISMTKGIQTFSYFKIAERSINI